MTTPGFAAFVHLRCDYGSERIGFTDGPMPREPIDWALLIAESVPDSTMELGYAKQSFILRCPHVLSFATSPEGAQHAVDSVRAVMETDEGLISIDFSEVERVDLCAGSVLIAAASDRARSLGVPVRVELPPRQQVVERLITCGLGRLVPVSDSLRLPDEALQPLSPLRYRESWTDHEELVAFDTLLDLSSKLRGWLARNLGAGLSHTLHRGISAIIGEVAENAPAHGESDWWFCADIHRDGPESEPSLHFVIFNFGVSMAERIGSIPGKAGEVLHNLKRLHEEQGLFGTDWSEENLRTMFALQEFATTRGWEERRGGGSVVSMTWFEKLLGTGTAPRNSSMCWVTGRTRIFHDGEYRIGISPFEGREGMSEIAFNEANDLRQRPDRRAVYNLPTSFPGTLLTVQIALRPELLTVEDAHA